VLFFFFCVHCPSFFARPFAVRLRCQVYEKAFDVMGEVKPPPSAQNKATLHYNCARAAANVGRQLSSLAHCDRALGFVSG